MYAKRGVAWLRGWRGLACLAFVGVFGLPGLTKASPGCQALNGQSGTIAAYGYVQLLTNSQPVNQGDYVTLTASGQLLYVGSFLQMNANGNTVSGSESASGAGADNLSNLLNSSTTYSITCTSAGATISSVSPSSATAGSAVTISGTGLWGTSQVLFGATPATSFTVTYGAGGAVTNATVPNGSGTVAITLVTDAGTYTGGSFTFAPPTANPASATVAYGSSNNAVPLSISGPATAVAVASAPAHGSAAASGTSITYTPAASYAGSDSFTYTASDAAGTSSPATVTITVSPPSIVLAPASLPAMQDGVPFSQGLAASGGASPYAYSISSGSLPAGLSLNGSTGALSGTPTYAGAYSFTVQARDSSPGTGPYTGTQTYSGTVAAPILTLQPGSTLSAATAESSYSASFSTTGGTPPYTYTISAGALPAGLSLSSSGTLSGTPTASGTYNFTIRSIDSSTGTGAPFSATQAYALQVNAPSLSVTPGTLPAPQMGTPYSQQLTASGGNGSYSFSVSAGALPAGLTLSSGGLLAGTPTVSGTFNVTITAKDSLNFTASQAYVLNVGLPAVPTVAAKSAATAYNTVASIDLSGSIAGVDITAVTIGTAPAHGTVSVSGETVTYTPSPTFYGGADSFTYTATNPGGTSAPATVTITVSAPAAPTVAAKSVTAAYNEAAAIDLTGSITGVDITVVTIGTAPAHGAVSVSGETVTYTPSPTFYGGADSFTYTATNPGGTSAPATVTITVGAPAAPTAATRAVTTSYNTAASIDLTGSITGVDITAVAIGTAPAHGTVSVSGETVTYTPSATFYGGSDSFTYSATNPGGTSAMATVTITVGAPAAPTVAAKSVTTAYSTAAAIDLSGSITGVDIAAVAIGTAPAHGTVSVSGETMTYTPSSAYYGGTDSFTYTATNPGGTSAPATVTVAVTPLSVPVAQAINVSATSGTSVLIAATAGAIGPQPLTGASVASAPAHGTASANGEQITYVPTAGFVGTDSFTYRVANHFGSSAPAAITVQVTAAGRLGAATGTRTVTAAPGAAVTVNMAQIVPDTYVSSTLTGLSPGNAGSIALGQPATLTFTPMASFRGLVQISATLTAASGRQVTIGVLVLVSSQPDPSKNPEVLGLVNAQTEQAKHFAQSQLDNIEGRLESLHDGGGTALFSNALSISLDGKAMQAPLQGDPNATAIQPGGHGPSNPDESLFGSRYAASGRSDIGTADMTSTDAAVPGSSPNGVAGASTDMGSGSKGLGLWVAGSANFGTFEAYRQAAGFDSDNIAVNVGVDQRLGPHALVGFSLGYNHDDADISGNGTRSVANGYSAALYGSYQPTAQTYLDLVLGGGGLGFDSRRYAADSGSALTGRRNGSQWFGAFTAGYEYRNQGGLLVSPYLRLERSLSELNGFSEQGAAAAALAYGSETARMSLAVLGLRASGRYTLDWGVLMPHARLEIGHDFEGTSNVLLGYASIPSAGSWNVLTNPYAANGTSVQLGLGLDLELRRNLRLTTDYEYLMQPHAHDQAIRFGLHKQF